MKNTWTVLKDAFTLILLAINIGFAQEIFHLPLWISMFPFGLLVYTFMMLLEWFWRKE